MSLSDFSPHRANKARSLMTTTTTTTSSMISESSSVLGVPSSPLYIHSPIVIREGDIPGKLRHASESEDQQHLRYQHLYVLPVLLLEFLAIALTRAVLPAILLQEYGSHVYLVLGCADCVRGFLAFWSCPIFGKLSDIVGRRLCLLITVMGTCAPMCSLALFSWQPPTASNQNDVVSASAILNISEAPPDVWQGDGESMTSSIHYPLPPNAISIFIVLLALSGVFSSTFTLVFAYISDTVKQRDDRVSAYGLALATFGLSFTIGPMAGGYLAQSNTHYVFLCSLLLTILDVLYIYFILPESKPNVGNLDLRSGAASIMSLEHNMSWSPWETLRVVAVDPFLRRVGQVAFLYYTGLWALISTLSIYAVQRFHLTPERLGELMASLGLCTMIAEAVLVRVMVPLLGEKQSMKVGLLSFAVQCVILGLAYEGWHLFVCVAFSLLGNLVYPSLSSLVSGSVEPEAVGEALGAVNGIKALTEGIGPLLFGGLMTLSEKSALPGWPYLLASLLILAAYKVADGLPDVEDDDYIHELEFKVTRQSTSETKKNESVEEEEEEYQRLLSEIEESDEEDDNVNDDAASMEMAILPLTFSSLVQQDPPGMPP
jgi:DHA1 family tetracycline resistance protein-like MFS transporter